jgi:hypothetical protein
MRLSRVQIIKLATVSPEPGTFTATEQVVDNAFMKIIPATANTIYQATLREESVSHIGEARANDKWNAVNTGDCIGYGTRRFRVVRVRDDGEIDSRWLRFELDESSLKEEHSDG